MSGAPLPPIGGILQLFHETCIRGMPRRFKRRRLKRRTSKKRSFRRKTRRPRIAHRRRRLPLTGVGQFKIVKLKFIDTTNRVLSNGDLPTPGTDSPWYYVPYQINSAYSPQLGAASSYGMPGYSEWCAFYSEYIVLSCKIRTRFTNVSDTNMQCGIFFTSVSTPGNWSAWTELPGNRNAVSTTIAPGAVSGGGTQTAGTNTMKTLSMYRKLGNVLGNSKNYYSADDWVGVAQTTGAASTPASALTGFVYVCAIGNTDLPAVAAYTETQVTMWVKFFGVKELSD
nr:MAG: capsid protein [Cressdnaviricota sp.]